MIKYWQKEASLSYKRPQAYIYTEDIIKILNIFLSEALGATKL